MGVLDSVEGKHPACACPECRAMCRRRPCWPTPQDAERLIAAGLGGRLMLDWWFDRSAGRTVYVLAPAVRGREGNLAPLHPTGACTFLTDDEWCEIHAGPIPTEGRLSLCGNRTPEGLHEAVAARWNSDEGRALVARWDMWREQQTRTP